jgi:uncharacterized membrane protein YjjP (DUF1212 family)
MMLAPFAAFFRFCYSRPVLAIILSTVAGVFAHLTGHEHWMAILISFAAYLLFWMDEAALRARQAAAAPAEAD